MAILVDPAIWPWRGRRWAHLVSDANYQELHAFAARLGLRREHFQGDHYDVPTALRERAVGLGAEPVAARDLVRRLRAAGLRRPRPGRPAGAPDETSSSAPVLLVDGANVIGARPDGWWRDRPRAARRLHTGLALLLRRGDAGTGTDADVVLVLEGAAVEGLEEGRHAGVRVAWARRRGRDAADDRIVELVTELRGDSVAVGVVTSDRALAARVREAGGHVQGAGAFRRHVDALLEGGDGES